MADTRNDTLHLDSFKVNWLGQRLTMGCIVGELTPANGKNTDERLASVAQLLALSRERGDTLVATFPPSRPSYFFYDRLGFATTLYVDRRHYVSDAPIRYDGEFTFSTVNNPPAPRVVGTIVAIQDASTGTVALTHDQVVALIDRNARHGGRTFAAFDPYGQIVAVRMAEPSQSAVTITAMFASDINSERAMIREIGSRYSSLPLVYPATVSEDRPKEAIGMTRIVNALTALEAVAASAPAIKMAVRIVDPILIENSHAYILRNGSVAIDDTPRSHYDLDIDITVMTALLSSSSHIGEIFNLPTERLSAACLSVMAKV